MDDVAENLRNERREPSRPTRGDIREWATADLRGGTESVEGFEDTLREVADRWGGEFTDEEFRDLARETFEKTLTVVLDEEGPRLDAEAHETLDTFRGPFLTFSRSLAPRLLDGDKNATVRYDLDEEIRPGAEVVLRTPGALGEFGTATVADVIRTSIGDALDAVDDAGYRHNAESVGDLWFDLNLYYEDDLGLSTEVAVVLLDDITEEVR